MPVICINEKKAYLVFYNKSNIGILKKTQGGVVQNVFFEMFSIPPHRGFSFEYPPSPTPIEVPVPPYT